MGVEVEDLRRVRFLEPLKDRALKGLAAGMTERVLIHPMLSR